MRLPGADGITLAADAFGDPSRPAGRAAPRRRPDPARVGQHGPPARRRRVVRADRRPARPRRQRLVAGRRLQPRALRRGRRWPSRPSLDATTGARRRVARRHRQPARRRRVGDAGRDRPSCSSTSRRASSRPAWSASGRSCARASSGFADLEEAADAIAVVQPAPAPPEGPLRADQEPAPARRRPLVLALGPPLHGARGSRRTAASTASRRPASCRRSDWRRRPARSPSRRSSCAAQASDLLSEEGARHLLTLIPHAQLVDVAGAGHMVAGDRNDHFNAAVVDRSSTPRWRAGR